MSEEIEIATGDEIYSHWIANRVRAIAGYFAQIDSPTAPKQSKSEVAHQGSLNIAAEMIDAQAAEIAELKKLVSVNGIYLVTEKNKTLVKIDVNGVWVTVIEECYDGDLNISHIVEPLGMRKCIERSKPARH